jgi:hypothetical protein
MPELDIECNITLLAALDITFFVQLDNLNYEAVNS